MAASASPHEDSETAHVASAFTRPGRARQVALAGVGVLGLFLLISLLVGEFAGHGAVTHDHALTAWPVGVIPFALLLLAVAILPILPPLSHWWHSNLNRLLLSLAAASGTVLYLLLATDVATVGYALHHALIGEYTPFIILLFSLYVITGGISIHADLPATPATNTAILGLGTLLASIMGTTGASMLLIRPLLQANRRRTHRTHTVVFFIFLVSNIGGSLLPVGDPPLFLGYLRGVPFLWTLTLWDVWLFACIPLLVVYFIWDSRLHRREPQTALHVGPTRFVPQRIDGGLNFLWLLVVLLAVATIDHSKPLPGTDWHPPRFLREAIMLGATGLSLLFTPRGARTRNEFNYAAILEVAAIFVGIFITMQVPLMLLGEHGTALGLSTPGHYFWATGVLSSFLDNAPTYEIFFETALAATVPGSPGNVMLAHSEEINGAFLRAISVGAVFMGANTYIGNGPNFMVKSVAEASGVRMPSFFGYMAYSVAVLLPLFIMMSLVFFA
jgi:Na+/H+ antiporter NhaD/arsenite permease-like protein